MTRITFITTILISVILLTNEQSWAGTKKMNLDHHEISNSSQATSNEELPVPHTSHSQPVTPHKKASGPSMEELPHIHLFHKDRVKKVKKHPNRLWVVAKLILVLCHVGLLIMGYLHATH